MKHLSTLIIISVFLLISNSCISPNLEDADKTKQLISNEGIDYPDTSSMGKSLPKADIESLSIDDAINLVIQYNPELKASEKDIDAASARIIQAKLLPNPSVFVESENDASKSLVSGKINKSIFGLSQPIPLGGKISARTEVAAKEKDIASLNYELKLRQIIAETKKTFVTILTSKQLVDIANANLEVARNLFDAVKTRVEARVVPETELIKAEIQLFQAQVNLKNNQTELFQAQKRLNNFFGNIDIKVKRYTGELKERVPELTGETIEKETIASYPELANARKMRELAKAQYRLAQSEKYPDIDIGIGTGKERGDLEDSKITEWSINIPLPLFDRNQGRIKETKILIDKSDKEYENTLNKVNLEIKQTLASLENIIHQVKTYKEKILPQAEKSLALISEGYKEGRFTYLELLDAQRTLTETRQDYIRFLKDLNNTAVDIEYLTGKSIDKLK